MTGDEAGLEQKTTSESPLASFKKHVEALGPQSPKLRALSDVTKKRYLEAYIGLGKQEGALSRPDPAFEEDLPQAKKELEGLEKQMEERQRNEGYRDAIQEAERLLDKFQDDFAEHQWGKQAKETEDKDPSRLFHTYEIALGCLG
jgi:hypothetical protein